MRLTSRSAHRVRWSHLPLLASAVLLGLFSRGSSIASAAGPTVISQQPVQIVCQPFGGATINYLDHNVYPEAINGSAQVTGYQLLSTGRDSAFSWKNGAMLSAPTGVGNYGHALNDYGWVAGEM